MIIASELITDKLQQLFGKQYEMHTLHAFNERFTNPVKTPFGAYDVQYQCFDKYADKIIGVVQVQPTAQNFTVYEYTSVNFTVQFWVPLNFVKMSMNGETLEELKFDFKSDVKRVDNSLRGKETELKLPIGLKENGEFDYEHFRAFFTLAEPVLSSGKEISGAYNRVVYTVSGTVSICEQKVNVGNDYEIYFLFGSERVKIEQYRTLAIGSTTEASSIQPNNGMDTINEPAVKDRQMTFFVDDVQTDNKAFALIEKKAFTNHTVINPNEADEMRKRQIHVQVEKRGVVVSDFWGNISTQYSVTGGNGFGSYQVSIMDSGDD